MQRRGGRWISMFLAVLVLGAFVTCPALAITPIEEGSYILTDLGGPNSSAYGINDAGHVVGSADFPEAFNHAFLYRDGTMIDLGVTGVAYKINNAGVIIGKLRMGELEHPFLYSNGELQDLWGYAGYYFEANGINDAGQIVGTLSAYDSNHAFLLSNGTLTDLGTLGGTDSYAYGINDFGAIAGSIGRLNNGTERAMLYKGGQTQDLGTLGGNHSRAYDINNAEQVVGYSDIRGNAAQHAFLYSNRRMTDLGTLGGTNSVAWAINDQGHIVGSSDTVGNIVSHAFLYRDGQMTDLNTLLSPYSGWELVEAKGINNLGQIVGTAVVGEQSRAFLMTPLCNYGIGAIGASFESAAGSDSVQITAGSGCSWTASSTANWITITSGASGSGSGTTAYSVAANPSTSSRSGTLTIAGTPYTVTQNGSIGAGPKGYTFCSLENQRCSFSGSLSVAFGSNGLFAYKTLAGGADCTSGIFGDPNPGVNKACFTKGANCSFTLSPNAKTFTQDSQTATVTVSAASSKCTWTSTSNEAWITITSGGTKTGNGSVSISLAANTGTTARTGTLTIAGQTFTVTQNAVPHYTASISRTGSGTVNSADGRIQCGALCSAEYTANSLLTLTAAADSGSAFTGWSGGGCSGLGPCSLTINSNITTTATFVPCSVSISPASGTAAFGGDSGTVTVSATAANCPWTATSNAPWLTITSGASGTGNGTVTYAAAANTSADPRTGSITVAGQNFTVTQTGVPHYALNISKTGQGTGTITSTDGIINCGTGCSAIYPSTATVTLTATPDSGATFAGWSGGGCSGVGTCTVAMSANAAVSAAFDRVSPIKLTVAAPANGSTINGTVAVVQGTVTNALGRETGVAVNGIAASIYGNQFVVNSLPLTAGANTITATATDSAGSTATAAVTVNAVPSAHSVRATATPQSGVAPLQTTIRVDGSFSVSNPVITVTGPASAEIITSTNPNEYVYRMTTEGIYYFTAQAIGPDGNIYQNSVAVTVMNRTQVDGLLQQKWAEMKSALSNGNAMIAANSFSAATKEKYQTIFSGISGSLSSMAAEMRPIELISVGARTALYRIKRAEDGNDMTYFIYFLQDEDGLWKILQF